MTAPAVAALGMTIPVPPEAPSVERGGTVARVALRRAAIAAACIIFVTGTPVLCVVGLAAWQQYHPTSLRMVLHRASALTEAPDAGGVIDNMRAAVDQFSRHPG